MLQSMGHKESETTERLNNFWLCCDLAAVCVHSLAEVSGLLIEAASLVQEHRLSSQRAHVYLLFGTLYVPRLGIQPKPLPCKGRLLTTGPPGTPLLLTFTPEVHPVHHPAFQNCRTDPISFHVLAPPLHRACGGRVSRRGNAGFFSTTHERGVQQTSTALVEFVT